jgi:hypothetical protein
MVTASEQFPRPTFVWTDYKLYTLRCFATIVFMLVYREYVYKRTSSQIHRLENHFSDPAPLAARVVTSRQGYRQFTMAEDHRL